MCVESLFECYGEVDFVNAWSLWIASRAKEGAVNRTGSLGCMM